MKSAIPIVLLILSSFALFAQNMNDTIVSVSEVKITEKRILQEKGLSETILDSSILAQNKTTSLSDLLSENSSIFIKSYGQGSLASASFRGTGASHTQILWNGISLNNPMLGQVDLSLIPVYFIDKAKILSGGSSLKSVSGALGGSIELNSLPNFNKKYTASFIQSFGSSKTFQSFLKAGVGFQKFSTVFKLFHEQSQNDFLYLNTATGDYNYEKQKNADYVKNAVLNETYFKISDKQFLSLISWYQTNNRNLPPIMSFQGTDREENQTDDELRLLAKYNLYSGNFKSEIIAGIIQEHLNYFLADHTETELFIHTNSKSKTNSLTAKYSLEYKPAKKLFFKSSLSYEHQKADYYDKQNLTGYDAERQIAEWYFAGHYEFSKYVIAYTFFRANMTDKKILPLMPSIGFEIQPMKNLPFLIKSNFSRNYHNPTLNDLYWIPGGNPDLKPEQGYSSDLSLNWSVKKNNFTLKTDVTSFASYITNWIIWKPGEFRYWQAENIKKVFSRGIEFSLSANYQINSFKTSVRTNYSFTKTTNENSIGNTDLSVGKQLIYIPVNKANTLFNIDFFQYTVSLNHTFTGKRFTSSSEEETRHQLPAFNLINLSFGRKFELKKIRFDTQFKVKNLFNEDYQEILWRAMPDRHFLFVLKISIL